MARVPIFSGLNCMAKLWQQHENQQILVPGKYPLTAEANWGRSPPETTDI